MPKKDGASKRLEVAISGAQYIKPWFVTNDGGKTARFEYFGLLNFPPSNVLKDAQIKPAALMHLDAGNYLDQPILAAFKTFGTRASLSWPLANIAYLSCQRSFRWAAGARAAKEIRLGPIVFAGGFCGQEEEAP